MRASLVSLDRVVPQRKLTGSYGNQRSRFAGPTSDRSGVGGSIGLRLAAPRAASPATASKIVKQPASTILAGWLGYSGSIIRALSKIASARNRR